MLSRRRPVGSRIWIVLFFGVLLACLPLADEGLPSVCDSGIVSHESRAVPRSVPRPPREAVLIFAPRPKKVD